MSEASDDPARERTVTVTSTAGQVERAPGAGAARRHAGSAADFARRYELLGELGRGGMGLVELARDRQSGREVALKRLLPGAQEDPAAVDRFLREIRTQAQLEHPAVVPVYDVGSDDAGRPYFTMKRVSGRTLRELLEELRERAGEADPPPLVRRLDVVARVADALSLAHSRGILHRDLKPSNVMITEAGAVYVLDWGIAGGAAEPSAGGSVYAAPEQRDLDAQGAGPELDVWALGQLLYESLTLARARLEDAGPEGEIRPSETHPELAIPPELDALCADALVLDPRRRLASAADFRRRLRDFLNEQRDGELRGRLARRHVEEAREALERDGSLASRRVALAGVGRALGLGVAGRAPLELLSRLLSDPPREEPASVRRVLSERAREEAREALRFGAGVAFGTVVVLVLFAAREGILAPGIFAALAAGLTAAGGVAAFGARPGRGRLPEQLAYVALSGFNFFVAGRILSPLVLAPPLFVALAAIVGGMHDRSARLASLAFLAACFVASVLAPELGALAQTQRFEAGALWIAARVLPIERVPSIVAATATTLGSFLAVAVVYRIRELLERQRRVEATTRWQILHVVGAAEDPSAAEAKP